VRHTRSLGAPTGLVVSASLVRDEAAPKGWDRRRCRRRARVTASVASLLSYGVGSQERVDEVLAEAVAAGATLVKPGQPTTWVGHNGYFAPTPTAIADWVCFLLGDGSSASRAASSAVFFALLPQMRARPACAFDTRPTARQAEPGAAAADRGRYARSAGFIFPGRCRGGEVRCESGAVPQLRCPTRGRARSTGLRRERTSALGGRAVRAAPAAGPPPPQTRRFFL
jgi:hypothetical protein